MYQTFLDGEEKALRTEAAKRIDYQKKMEQYDALQEYASKKGGPLEPNEVFTILNGMDPYTGKTPVGTLQTDPDTVIEKGYSDKTLSALNTAKDYMSPGNPLSTALQNIPDQVDTTLDQGSDLLMRNQYLLSKIQDMQNETANQSWPGYLLDFARNSVQPYVELKERGSVPGVGWFDGLGIGSNTDEAGMALYRMPIEQFKATVDKITDNMKNNPQLAQSYLSQLMGQSPFEKVANNIFTALEVPNAVGTAVGSVKLAKKVVAYNQLRKAAKDIVTAAAQDVSADPTNIKAAAGDITGAAVDRVAGEVVEAIGGNADPLKTVKNSLVSAWGDLQKNFAENPGTILTREAYTRLYDGISNDLGDLYNRLVTNTRVERQPLIVKSQEALKTLQDKMRNDFKGPHGMILDIGGVEREELSGTYWWRMKLGDYDASLFADEATARGRAEQIGIQARILGTPPDKVYIPEAAILRNEYTDFRIEKPTSKGSSTFNGLTKDQVKDTIAEAKRELQTPGLKSSDRKLLESHIAEHEAGLKTFGTGKKGSPKTVRNEYLPGSTKKVFRDDFEIQHTDKGVRFFNKDGVEVVLSNKPQPGHIPYNIKTGKFEPQLTEATARLEQQGLGFYIEHLIPLREQDNVLRDLMVRLGGEEQASTNQATGIRRQVNAILGWVRNSEDTLSKEESRQRLAATYAKTNIERWGQALNKDLEDLKNGVIKYDPVTGESISGITSYPRSWLGKLIPGKDIYDDFMRALDYSRKANDGKGAFFKNIGEMQGWYNLNFNRDPSYLEIKSYFNYVKVKEGERMIAELSEFRNRAIGGYEQKQLHYLDGQGNVIKTKWFDGRELPHFPSGNEYIYIQGERTGQVKKLGKITTKYLNNLKEAVNNGSSKVIEIYDVDHYPLQGFDDALNNARVRYILTDKVETKPLEFNHVENRGGAHFEWDYDHYIKQADIRKQPDGEHLYTGDITVMPIASRAVGQKVTKIWNEIHDLLKIGDWESAKPLVAKLGIDWNQFTGWYHPGRNEVGNVIPPRLNFNEPMQVVSKDKRIKDMDNSLDTRYKKLTDATRSGSANNFKVAYNRERNSFADWGTINDIGTKNNPVFAHQPANFVDPISTMNRSLNRAINSVFMDDYKIYAVEHWLREAEPWLQVKGKSGDDVLRDIRSSPFWHFQNPDYRSDIDFALKANLESNRYKIRAFVGLPSTFDSWVHSFTNTLLDRAYLKGGPNKEATFLNSIKHPINVAPIWMLHRIKNPTDFIRGCTFNAKLGLFNPAQFIVQAQTHALIWSLEPQHGTVGTYAMLLHGWSRVNKNPEILAKLDEYATKLNGFGSKFRPGEWLEAMQELDKTGFSHVAGEYANLSKSYMPTTNFFQGQGMKFLRAGQTPFRLGEESTRITAWYTAFRKYREVNPTTPIDNIERQKILQHADLLTVNMSRASSSALNHGIFSMSTQFLNYQIKLAELFWSKRLGETPLERMRIRAQIVMGFGLLYGVSNTIGVTGMPFSDNLRQHIEDDLGYIPGEKWLTTLVNEGLPAWMLSMITGRVENVGDRFGSQGWTNIKQALNGSIPWWQAVGGAGLSTASRFASDAMHPFWQWGQSFIRGEDQFTIHADDLVQPFKQISTVSTGAKWWTAMQTSKWINNQEGYVTDVSKLEASILALTGMSPQEQDDMFLRNQMVKGEIDAQKEAFKHAIIDYRRGLEAYRNGDPDQGDSFTRNARATLEIAGYPPEKIASFIAIGNRGYESMIDETDQTYWMKGDFNKRDMRRQRRREELLMQDKK